MVCSSDRLNFILNTEILNYKPQTTNHKLKADLKLFQNIPSWMKNKYLLTAIGFAVWMLFFDDRDFITTQFKHREELKKLEQSKKYFEEQIATTKTELEKLRSNPATLEKYAREKYLMKRDNEDLFLIRGKQ